MKTIQNIVWFLFSLTVFFILLLGIKWYHDNFNRPQISDSPQQEQSVAGWQEKFDLQYRGKEYKFGLIDSSEFENVSLKPNYDEKLTAKQAQSTHNCGSLINAGFYTEDYKPIGYFATNLGKLSDRKQSMLFNGFLSFSHDNLWSVSTQLPSLDANKFVLQSGPMLFLDGNKIQLSMKNDKPARRMVAANTEKGMLFLAVYGSTSAFDGPTLQELPEILGAFDNKYGFGFYDAINLDGGSASAMITDDLYLPELSFIGSFFCLK